MEVKARKVRVKGPRGAAQLWEYEAGAGWYCTAHQQFCTCRGGQRRPLDAKVLHSFKVEELGRLLSAIRALESQAAGLLPGTLKCTSLSERERSTDVGPHLVTELNSRRWKLLLRLPSPFPSRVLLASMGNVSL